MFGRHHRNPLSTISFFIQVDVEKKNDTVVPAQAPIVEESEAEAAAAGVEVIDAHLDISIVIDIRLAGNLIFFSHLEYHWFPTLLLLSDGLRYLSHCSTPLPCCMERVLVALVFAAICAVLYYVQLYWVLIMQCLLAFVLFTDCDVSAFKSSEQRR